MPRVIVVGSGIAGLTTALRVSSFADVTLLTKGSLEESNTLYAQGGIAAAIFDDDDVDLHVADTLLAGAGLGDEEAVRILCSEGPARVRELIAFGVPFDREGAGLARGLEAAHSRARVLHAGGDATGRAIELTLAARVRASGVRILEHTMLADIVVEESRVVGARVVDDRGNRSTLAAEAVVLATGGAGRLYAHTTNPAVATGDGVAAAWRAGAELADLEFYQFHPTALAAPGGTLVSEAVRGEGAVLVDASGSRFMTRVHPDAELAPRDIVARGIARQMQLQNGSPVLLDATRLGRAFLARRFPTIQAACDAAGLDWARQPIPVTPAAHYWMGGVRTDAWARTSIPGLFAVGEAACTGAQGANRLASNSLLEGLVFAARAADALSASELPASPLTDTRTASTEPGEREPRERQAGTDGAPSAADELRDVMWRFAGVERDADGLTEALGHLDRLQRGTSGDAGRADRASSAIAELEERNLLTIGRLVVLSALARGESRGAHFRRDFPETDATGEHSIMVNRAGEAAIGSSHRLSAREGFIGEVVAAC
jgi:L-aspartate oxidase